LVVCTFQPTYSWKYKIGLQLGQTGQNVRLYFQNNQSKKGWGHGTGGRVPVSKHKVLRLKPKITRRRSGNSDTTC
jgi:hypothetical protein